ncbi:MAG: hypothetical protein ACRDPA_25065, partial [Solirubrobacteraceae bacterium]
ALTSQAPNGSTRLEDALNRLAASYRVNRLFLQAAYRTAIRWAMLRGLAEAPTSAALRAALYRVLATTTGELLQTSRTLLHRSRLYPGQAPGLNYRVTFLASGVVTSTRARVP